MPEMVSHQFTINSSQCFLRFLSRVKSSPVRSGSGSSKFVCGFAQAVPARRWNADDGAVSPGTGCRGTSKICSRTAAHRRAAALGARRGAGTIAGNNKVALARQCAAGGGDGPGGDASDFAEQASTVETVRA